MSATSLWLIGAVLAQSALVFVITTMLYFERIPRVVRREVRIGDIALDRSGWPKRAQQVANAFSNQFEVPVLFFVAVGIALYFGATLLEAALAWLFVASRCVHAFIHVTSNHVPRRFLAYAVGVIIMALFWVDLIVRLVMIAAGGTA
jgi:hypothetical protein